MACELATRSFTKADGTAIVVTSRQLPASKSLELYVEMVGKLGNSVFPLIDDRYSFGDLLSLMRSNDSAVVTKLVKEVVCHSNIDGVELKPALFDMTFGNDLMVIWKIFAFVLEANYNAFFKEGLEMNEQWRLAEAKRLEQSQQPEQI